LALGGGNLGQFGGGGRSIVLGCAQVSNRLYLGLSVLVVGFMHLRQLLVMSKCLKVFIRGELRQVLVASLAGCWPRRRVSIGWVVVLGDVPDYG